MKPGTEGVTCQTDRLCRSQHWRQKISVSIALISVLLTKFSKNVEVTEAGSFLSSRLSLSS